MAHGRSIGRFTSVLALVLGVGVGTAVGLGASLVAPAMAGAAGPFTVNDTGDFNLVDAGHADDVHVDQLGQLHARAAIEASNNAGGDTTINVPPGTYTSTTPPSDS